MPVSTEVVDIRFKQPVPATNHVPTPTVRKLDPRAGRSTRERTSPHAMWRRCKKRRCRLPAPVRKTQDRPPDGLAHGFRLASDAALNQSPWVPPVAASVPVSQRGAQPGTSRARPPRSEALAGRRQRIPIGARGMKGRSRGSFRSHRSSHRSCARPSRRPRMGRNGSWCWPTPAGWRAS